MAEQAPSFAAAQVGRKCLQESRLIKRLQKYKVSVRSRAEHTWACVGTAELVRCQECPPECMRVPAYSSELFVAGPHTADQVRENEIDARRKALAAKGDTESKKAKR